MGRFIDETELEKYIMHDGCEKGCGYIDERDLKFIPTVEAIPKDQYETRLKADLEAILTELQLEIEELDTPSNGDAYMTCSDIIQQKINDLKGEIC